MICRNCLYLTSEKLISIKFMNQSAYPMPTRKYTNTAVYEYKSNMKSILATTRFNNTTLQENQLFLENAKTNGIISLKTKCLYNCTNPIASTIPVFATIFVLEMNNEINRIEGIGLIKNLSPEYGKYPIYSNSKYNEYTYQGFYHIHRYDMNEEETKIVLLLEGWCFRGKRHQKRLQGIKAFPYDILYDYLTATGTDIVTEIANMFKTRFLFKPKDQKDQMNI